MSTGLIEQFLAANARLSSLHLNRFAVRGWCGKNGARSGDSVKRAIVRFVPELTNQVDQLEQLQDEILSVYDREIAEASAQVSQLTEQLLHYIGLAPTRTGNVWSCTLSDPQGEMASYPYVTSIATISSAAEFVVLGVGDSLNGRDGCSTTVTAIKKTDGTYEVQPDLY